MSAAWRPIEWSPATSMLSPRPRRSGAIRLIPGSTARSQFQSLRWLLMPWMASKGSVAGVITSTASEPPGTGTSATSLPDGFMSLTLSAGGDSRQHRERDRERNSQPVQRHEPRRESPPRARLGVDSPVVDSPVLDSAAGRDQPGEPDSHRRDEDPEGDPREWPVVHKNEHEPA